MSRNDHKQNPLYADPPAKTEFRRRRVFLFVPLTMFALLIVAFAAFDYTLHPIALSRALAAARITAVRSLQSAVLEADGSDLYGQMVHIERDNTGQITYLSVNSHAMNEVSTRLAYRAMEIFSDKGDLSVSISITGLIGGHLFAGTGPRVTLKYNALCSMSAGLRSTFSSVGINQTRHSVYADFNIFVRVTLPRRSDTLELSYPVLLCESVIVGQVPSAYLDSLNGADMLDLVP